MVTVQKKKKKTFPVSVYYNISGFWCNITAAWAHFNYLGGFIYSKA